MFWILRIFVVVILLLPLSANAQTKYQPKYAKASIQVLNDKVTLSKNRKATVKFTITPDKDWCVYSINEKNGSPITVESSNEELYTIGKLTEFPKPTVEYDEGFEANICKHISPVTITVPIQFSKKANLKSINSIELLIQFQTPSFVLGSCISDEQPISIQVDKR